MEHWIKVVVTCRAQGTVTIDDALEEVGLIHVVRDGEDDLCVVACGTVLDLCLARTACARTPLACVSREDLELMLRDPADAVRVQEILSVMSWIDAEVIVIRMARFYVRGAATLGAMRAEIGARLGINTVAVGVV